MSGLARRTDSPLTLRRQKRLRPDRPCQRVVGVLSAHRMPGRSGVSPSEKRARLGFWQFCQCPLWAVRWLPPAAAGEALAARCRTPARPARLAALWPALPVWRDWAWCRPPQRSLSASERSLCGERPRASTGRQLPGLHAGAAETRCKVPGRPPLAAHPAQRPASTARGSAQRQLFDGVDTRKVAAVL